MKRLATSTAALALLCGVGAAQAADLSTGSLKDGTTQAGSHALWTGLYAGVNGGYFWQADGIGESDSGLIGGQVGFNLQHGFAVMGIEADLDAVINTNSAHFGTVRGRLGVAEGRFLFYGTGGYAFAGADYPGCSVDGWAAGAGVEYKFAGPWSMKAEYLHVKLTSIDAFPDADTVRLGVNFAITGGSNSLK
jgi:outer membrane immunogenic protein